MDLLITHCHCGLLYLTMDVICFVQNLVTFLLLLRASEKCHEIRVKMSWLEFQLFYCLKWPKLLK